jgi:N-sulfoglucosamine sulfohydrolase
MKHLMLLLSMTAILMAGCNQQTENKSESQQPNILFILSDDHSVPYLGCYDNPDMNTPNLDQLAAEGIRYNRAYTTAPQCVLSRAGIMTGRSTLDVRMTRFTAPLHRDIVAYPEKLREAGYYTGICGRGYHLDGNLKKDLPVEAEVLQKYGLQTFEDRVDFLHHGEDRNNHKVFTEFLEQVPEGKPFFLQLNYSDPHRKFSAPDFAPDPDEISVTGTLPDIDFVREDLAQHIGEINRMDMHVGLVLDELEKRGLKENTLVVFIGDNGSALLRGKGTLYECGVHVPLLACWPGHIKPGLVSDELISGEDIGPTFIDVANGETPEEMTGISFVNTFQDEEYSVRDYVFAVRGTHASGPPIGTVPFDLSRVVIGKRYKLIYRALWQLPYEPVDIFKSTDWWATMKQMSADGKLQEPWNTLYFSPQRPMYDLYDLEEDPYELNNLAGNPEYEEIEVELKSQLIEWMILNQDFLPLPLVLADPNVDMNRFL